MYKIENGPNSTPLYWNPLQLQEKELRKERTLSTFYQSPHLSPSRSVAHKAALLVFHFSLSLARALASSQDFQHAIVLSFSTVRRQVVLRRPTFLLPIGIQVSAVAQWRSLGILRTCPKNRYLLLFTSILILILPVLLLSSSLDTI